MGEHLPCKQGVMSSNLTISTGYSRKSIHSTYSGERGKLAGSRFSLVLFVFPKASKGFPGGTMVKNLPANAGDTGDMGSIPGSGRSPGGGHGNPLQYSCLENPMDRGAWWATAHGVARAKHDLETKLSTA